MEETHIKTGRKSRLFGRLWSNPSVESSLAITVVHGLGEHSGCYAEFAKFCIPHDCDVFCFDLLGHGRSPGRRGCIDSYDGVLEDLHIAFCEMNRRRPNAQHVLLGHSMGGNLALNYCLRKEEFDSVGHVVSGLILSAPILLPKNPLPRPTILAAWLTGYLLRWLTVNRPVPSDALTKPPQNVDQLKKDPLLHSRVSMYLATQIVSQGRWALDNAREIQSPTLVIYGGDDSLIDGSTCEHLAIRMGERATTQVWPNARHNLLNDLERQAISEGLLAWVKAKKT